MKKNTKIGMGLAMASIVSMAAVIPVFADVKPSYIETTGTVISINAENTVSGTVAGGPEKNEEDQNTSEIDFEKSPNFCKFYFDEKTMEEKAPEVKPSDYKDPAIRKLAEEYAKKGYFLSDCRFDATHFSSGYGNDTYAFCNGFSAVDDNKGNNKVYIQIVKATPEEFEWYMTSASVWGDMSNKVKKITDSVFRNENSFLTEQYSYDNENQIMTIEVNFKPAAAKAVG